MPRVSLFKDAPPPPDFFLSIPLRLLAKLPLVPTDPPAPASDPRRPDLRVGIATGREAGVREAGTGRGDVVGIGEKLRPRRPTHMSHKKK